MHLDDIAAMAELDQDDMLARIAELPAQCHDAWRQAQKLQLPSEYGSIERIIIVGMGGSAIGGALLQDLVWRTCDVPITLVRGYTLPTFARGQETLTVACSYSGNTEETLSCYKQAMERGTKTLAITTGGELAQLAREAATPLVQFDYQSQPRAALGYSFALLLGAFWRLGLVRDYTDDVVEAVAVLEAWQRETAHGVPTATNPAKQLAYHIEGRLPVIYGGGFLSATANRWKTQLNENAKSWAFFELLPELNHNAVVGLGLPEIVRQNAFVVLLRSELSDRRMEERWDVTQELLEREGVHNAQVWGRGETKLAHMLSLIHFGDYVSFYVAMLHGVNPTPVESIAFLKRRLAELGGAGD